MATALAFPDVPQGNTAGWDAPLKADLTTLRDGLDATNAKLILNPRGPWSAASTYAPGDLVTYQGSAWYALLASTNVLPTNPVSWGNLAKGGASGGSATDTRYLSNRGTVWRDSMPRGMHRDNMAAVTSGVEYMCAVPFIAGDAITTLFFYSSSTAWTAGTGSPHLFFTLRKYDGTLLGTTVDSPGSTWATSQRLGLALALNAAGAAMTTYTIPDTDVYYVGIVAVAGAGGVVPTLHGIASLTSAVGSAPTGNLIRLAGTTGTGLTTPASVAAGPLTPTGVGSFAYCGGHA